MNSQVIEAALKFMYRGNPRLLDIQVITQHQVYSFKIKKKYTILVVFVQGHEVFDNFGHFLIFFIRKFGTKIQSFQYFDSYSKPIQFYFEKFPFKVESISHPCFQQNDNTCGFIILYFAGLRTIYSFTDTIEYLNDLYNQAIVTEMAVAHFHHIFENLAIRPSRKVVYFPRDKNLVIDYVRNRL